jgi:hypothetical protein
MANPLASAADLQGEDLGDGLVSLRWTHPDAAGARGIRFDVYASIDPLRPLRTLVLTDLTDTRGTASVTGLDERGVVYFNVVARRGSDLALPSATLRVLIKATLAAVEVTPGGEQPQRPVWRSPSASTRPAASARRAATRCCAQRCCSCC